MKIKFTEMTLTCGGTIHIWDMHHLLPVQGEIMHSFDQKRLEQEQVKFRSHETCATFKRDGVIHYVQFRGFGWSKELAASAFEYWHSGKAHKVSLKE